MRISELGFCTGPGRGSCLRGQTSPLFTGAEAARLSFVQRGGTSSFGSSQFSQKNHPFPWLKGPVTQARMLLLICHSLLIVCLLSTFLSAVQPPRRGAPWLSWIPAPLPALFPMKLVTGFSEAKTHLPHHGKAARPLQRGAGNA